MQLQNTSKSIINRISLHILFWLISVAAFAYIFKISNTISSIDILYSLLFHLSVILGVYTNLFVLIPHLLDNKKYASFFFFSVSLVLTTSFLNQLTFDYFTDIVFPRYYFVSQFNYLETIVLVTIFFVGTVLFKLSSSWFKLQEINKQINRIEKENLNSQLKALKAQINPHFLFNSLNVLYSLTLKQSDDTPDAIIKLSDILRYVIYDSNKETVGINSEVELINNYLSLQKHRIDSTSNIHFETKIQDNVQIAPMLFLPLIENSFKHGVKGDVLDTYVKINIFASTKELLFEIENNKGERGGLMEDVEGGVGLENIEKRLSLLYPNKYVFNIKHDEEKFRVLLKIEL